MWLLIPFRSRIQVGVTQGKYLVRFPIVVLFLVVETDAKPLKNVLGVLDIACDFLALNLLFANLQVYYIDPWD